MDPARLREELEGRYVTTPTLFRDPDLVLDLDGIRRHVRWLIDHRLDRRYTTFLAGGAAGDFSTLSFEERRAVAEAVVEAARGRVPVAMGARTTSTARSEGSLAPRRRSAAATSR